MSSVCRFHIGVSVLAVAVVGVILYPLGGAHPAAFGSVAGWLVLPYGVGLLTSLIVGRSIAACVISLAGTGLVLLATVAAFLDFKFASSGNWCVNIPLAGLLISSSCSAAAFVVWGWWESRQGRVRGLG